MNQIFIKQNKPTQHIKFQRNDILTTGLATAFAAVRNPSCYESRKFWKISNRTITVYQKMNIRTKSVSIFIAAISKNALFSYGYTWNDLLGNKTPK